MHTDSAHTDRRGSRRPNPITEGVIWQQILFFFFPLLLSAFFQQLYNTADALIVGQAAGKEALSAVAGSAGSVLGMFITFYIGFSGGAAVLTAQFHGAGNKAARLEAIRVSLALSAAMGAAGALFCFVFAGPVLTAMRTPGDVLAPSLRYLRITALGLLPNALCNMGSAALRAMGDSRRPLAVLIAACVTNIGLDLLFVIVLGLGAPGAAAATSLCQLLSALLVLRCLKEHTGHTAVFSNRDDRAVPSTASTASSASSAGSSADVPAEASAQSSQGRENPAHRFDRSHSARRWDTSHSARRRDRNIVRKTLQMGIPLGLSEVMYTFANVILMAVINGFGTDTVAAYAAYGRIDAIFWMIVGSFGIAITTFVGQNIGAGRRDRVEQSIRDCALMMFLTLGIVILLLRVFAFQLQSLFCRDPAVIGIGVDMMRFLMPFYFLYIPVEILFGTLRGMGDSVIPTVITFFTVCVLRSAWGLFIVPLHHTANMVLLGYPVTWLASDIAFAIYFYRYWKKYWGKHSVSAVTARNHRTRSSNI